jgi:NAD(P)-dependent dehydrogenase (short-subunit alcohol dehydrogenase family)
MLPAIGIGVVLAAKELAERARETDLDGQVALITGGSRGLGLAIAHELAGHGCRLAICARDREELDRAVDELKAKGAEVIPIVCDVTVRSDVDAMVSEVLAHYGQIDSIYAVAGVIEVAELKALEVEDFELAMDVDFWGVLFPILAVLPHMRERKSGNIAIVTSIGGKIAIPHLLTYSAAKFAATGLAQGLSAELARDGITVTNIVPGLMRTGSHLNAQFKGDSEQQRGEFTWFSLGASSPLVPRADRAARIVVRAVRRGEPERVFTAPFDLASRFTGLMPSTTIRLARLANSLLPSARGRDEDVKLDPGSVVQERTDSRILDAATKLGDNAAVDFNQKPGPVNAPTAEGQS